MQRYSAIVAGNYSIIVETIIRETRLLANFRHGYRADDDDNHVTYIVNGATHPRNDTFPLIFYGTSYSCSSTEKSLLSLNSEPSPSLCT